MGTRSAWFRAVAAAILVASLAAIGAAQEPRTGGTLTVGIRNVDYDTLDPHVSLFRQSAYVFLNIFDRLVHLDPETGEFTAGLATSWEPNDDATVWTLTLREGVTFHDGTAFDAEAARFNFERMVDPATQSAQAGPLMGPYVETEIVDDFTVRVHFREPYAIFPTAMAQPFILMVSPTAVETYGTDFVEHLVGSGPFRFVSEIRGNEVVLERNPDYAWGPSFLHEGPAYVERLIFRFILEDETRLGALQTRELDIVDEIPPARFTIFDQDPNTQVFAAVMPGYTRNLWMNTSVPPTDEHLVRRAVNHAIDREGISAGVLGGVYPAAYNILTPPTLFYDASVESMYDFDPERAGALLDEAGWSEFNSAGYRVKDGRELRLFHATFPGFVAEAPAEVVQSNLRDVGIRFDINVMTGSAMMEGMASIDGTFNTALIGWSSVDPGLILSRVFHSSSLGELNWPHFYSDELDALLDRALQSTSMDERAELYAQIQHIVMEAATVAPIYADVSLFAARQGVHGIRFDNAAYPIFFDIHLD